MSLGRLRTETPGKSVIENERGQSQQPFLSTPENEIFWTDSLLTRHLSREWRSGGYTNMPLIKPVAEYTVDVQTSITSCLSSLCKKQKRGDEGKN